MRQVTGQEDQERMCDHQDTLLNLLHVHAADRPMARVPVKAEENWQSEHLEPQAPSAYPEPAYPPRRRKQERTREQRS